MKQKILYPFRIREVLLGKKIRIFTGVEFCRLIRMNHTKAKYFLENSTKRGLFSRIKKGLYSLASDPLDEREIANALYKPSYISFEYALAWYGIIPEAPYSITSATTKATRALNVQGKNFQYYTIKKEAFTGYQLVQEGKFNVFMAEPEKALVDYLYFVALGKKQMNDRLRIESLRYKKMLQYARLYERKQLENIIKKLFKKI